ncbi:hypothetical protein LTR53_014228 [Teratosphaeriaceae sp. CCFEE 6253]|nr:hypothetical protein LTR53_014228 [Teratosphaeriaceae sp. CCFEE 6253]
MSSTSSNTRGPMQSGGGSEEFHSGVQPREPMTTHGHQPGKLVGNEAKPEFAAATLPAGSAPSDATYQPNNPDSAPPVQQYHDVSATADDAPQASAADTLGGATSSDVNTGLGHPGQGQSSKELRDGSNARSGGHDGQLSGASNTEIDTDAMPSQRAINKDDAVVGREDAGKASAEDREPETAEGVASSRK